LCFEEIVEKNKLFWTLNSAPKEVCICPFASVHTGRHELSRML
jgi:hypothetical protein